MALVAIILTLLSAACAPPEEEVESFRSGQVVVQEVTSTVAPEEPSVTVLYTVENTDSEPISLASLSFEIQTSSRRHIHAVRLESPIPPKTKSWFETTLALAQEQPEISREDVTLLNAVFQ